MPLLYENTDRIVKRYSPFKLSPDLGTTTLVFMAGVAVGFIILPIVLPIAGYQLTKRFGPPPPPR